MDTEESRTALVILAVAILVTGALVFHIGSVHSTEYHEPGYSSSVEITQFDCDTYRDCPSYKITSVQGWNEFASLVNCGYDFSGKDVYLTCDLDFSYTLVSSVGGINGSEVRPFSGRFHGEGHTVSNVTHINAVLSLEGGGSVVSTSKGLFGAVEGTEEQRASVSDLFLSGTHVSGCGEVALLVAVCTYADISDCVTGADCNATLKSTPQSYLSDFQAVGGIVGVGWAFTVTNCVNNADITLDVTYSEQASGIGGIAGLVGDITGTREVPCRLTDVTNNGRISVVNVYDGNGYNVGGIVGSACDTVMESLVNNGSIVSDIGIIGTEGSGSYYWQGGIAGEAFNTCRTDYGTVTASGLINNGDMAVEISSVFNVDFGVGGIFGKNGGNLGSTYRVEDVGGRAEFHTYSDRGVVSSGLVQNGSILVTVENSNRYSLSDNTTWIGGIAGYLDSSMSHAQCNASIVVLGSNALQPMSVGGIAGGLEGNGNCGISESVNRTNLYVDVAGAVSRVGSDDFHVLCVAGIVGQAVSTYSSDDSGDAVQSVEVMGLVDIPDPEELEDLLPYVRGCENYGAVHVVVSNVRSAYISGIVGSAIAEITGCRNYGSVEVEATDGKMDLGISAIAAMVSWGSVMDSVNTADIDVTVAGEPYSVTLHEGAVLGLCRSVGLVSLEGCLSSGDVMLSTSARGSENMDLHVGGAVGCLECGSAVLPVTMRDIFASGKVEVNCAVMGSEDLLCAGALVGRLSGYADIAYCGASSDIGVYVADAAPGCTAYAGGLASYSGSEGPSTFRSCYFVTREITASASVSAGASVPYCAEGMLVLDDCYVLLGGTISVWTYSSSSSGNVMPAAGYVFDVAVADMDEVISILNDSMDHGEGYRWEGSQEYGYMPYTIRGSFVSRSITYDVPGSVPDSYPKKYEYVEGMTFSFSLPVPESPDPGRKFVGWTTGSGEPFIYFVSDMGDLVLTPVWEIIDQFKIHFDAENGSVSVGSVMGDLVRIRGHEAVVGDTVVVAVPDEGYQFSHWEIGGFMAYGEIPAREGIKVSAVFVETFHVYLSVEDSHAHVAASAIGVTPGTTLYLDANRFVCGNQTVGIYLDDGYGIRSIIDLDTGKEVDIVDGVVIDGDIRLGIMLFDSTQTFGIRVVLDGVESEADPYSYSEDGETEVSVVISDVESDRHIEYVTVNGAPLSSALVHSNAPGLLVLGIPCRWAVDVEIVVVTAYGRADPISEDSLAYSLSDGVLTITGTGPMRDYSQTDPAPWSGMSFDKVVIGSGVTCIGDYAFFGNYSLEYVDLGDTVISIGERAFYGCLLKSICFPLTFSYMDYGTFSSAFYINGNAIVDPSFIVLVCGVFHSGTAGKLDSGSTAGVEVGRINEVPATYSSEGSYDAIMQCSVCGMALDTRHVVVERLVSDEVYGEDNHYSAASTGTTVAVSSIDIAKVKGYAENSPDLRLDFRTPSATVSLSSESVLNMVCRDIVIDMVPEDVSSSPISGTVAMYHVDVNGDYCVLSVPATLRLAYSGPVTNLKVVDAVDGREYSCTVSGGYVSFEPVSFSEFAIVEVKTSHYSTSDLLLAVSVAIVIAVISAAYIVRYERGQQ